MAKDQYTLRKMLILQKIGLCFYDLMQVINLETIKQEVRESIVKGIIAGYKDYVNEK